MKVLIEDVGANREAFARLHEDTGKYGSSSIANIAGLGWRTPLEEFCVRSKRMPATKLEDSLTLQLGLWMEPAIGRVYAAKTGREVKPFNKCVQHDSLDWAIASPDFVTLEETPRIVEAKNRRGRMAHFYESGGMLDSDAIQCQWQMGVTGIQKADMAVLIGGDADEFYHPSIEYSEAVFSQLVEMVEKFREMVQSDTPPDAKAGDDKLIDYICKRHDGEVDITSSDCSDMVTRYRELQEKQKEINKTLKPVEDELSAIKTTLRLRANGATSARVGSTILEWRQIDRAATPASSYFRFYVRGNQND